MNKKAQSAVPVFIVMAVVLVSIIGLGLIAYASNEINTAFMSVDGMVGQVNFSEATENTWGEFNSGLINSLNFLGIALIFGLLIGMLVVAYYTRHEKPVLFFIIDILLLFIAFIVAGYISDSYEILIGVDVFNEIFVQNMNLVAKAMLNLPILVTVFGVLTMIISYIGIPKSSEEQVAGF